MPKLGLGLGLSRGAQLTPMYKKLAKSCGLLSYSKGVTDGVLIDKVGRSTRTAVQGRTLLYSAGSYIENVAFANQPITYTDGLGAIVNTTWDGSGQLLLPTNGIRALETTLSGETYDLYTQEDENNIFYQLVARTLDIEAPRAQQYLSPATPTEVNFTEVSMPDDNGYIESRALGKNLFDYLSVTVGYQNNLGVITPNSSWYTSDYVLIEGDISFVLNQITSNTIVYLVYFDENKNVINSITNENLVLNSKTDTTPSGTKYIRFSSTNANDPKETTQVELGTLATTYEAYQGYDYDQAGTLPIPQGHIIPNNALGIPQCYVAGVRPTADYSGRVKINRRVVDGVVDNGVDNANWNAYGNSIIGDSTITIGIDGFNDRVVLNGVITKPSSSYTLVLVLEQKSTVGQINITASGSFVDSDAKIVGFDSALGEIRIRLTSGVSPDHGIVLRSVSTDSEYVISDVRLYEGDLEIGTPPLPTTGAIVDGNSTTWAGVYNHIFKSDTTGITVDQTTHVNKALPVADMLHVTNDQMFATEDKQDIGFFNTEITGDCLFNALKYFKLIEPVAVGSGDVQDDDGTWYVLKGGLQL